MKRAFLSFASFACIIALTPQIARADVDLCALPTAQWEQALSEKLVGVWNVKNGMGLAMLNSMVIPLPTTSIGTMTIELVNGELTAVGEGSDMAADFDISFVPDEVWTFDSFVFSDDAPPYVDLETTAITLDLGCPFDLPRIRFSARIPIENTELTITMDVVLFDETTLVGVGDFVMPMNGATMQANRGMFLTKVGD